MAVSTKSAVINTCNDGNTDWMICRSKSKNAYTGWNKNPNRTKSNSVYFRFAVKLYSFILWLLTSSHVQRPGRLMLISGVLFLDLQVGCLKQRQKTDVFSTIIVLPCFSSRIFCFPVAMFQARNQTLLLFFLMYPTKWWERYYHLWCVFPISTNFHLLIANASCVCNNSMASTIFDIFVTSKKAMI